MFGSMGQTNVKNLGNGGTMDGDVTITGDLTVSGGIGLSLSEVIQGTSTIDITNPKAFLVRKDGDGGDVFKVDSTNATIYIQDGIGTLPSLFGGHQLVLQNNNDSGDQSRLALISGATGYSVLDFGDASDVDAGGIAYQNHASDDLMTLRVNGTDFVNINDSGFGIGKSTLESTDSNWVSLELGGNGALINHSASGAGKAFIVSQNAYMVSNNFNTGMDYMDTDEASCYLQHSGTHTFRVSGSGTADASITWTDALTIANDSSATFSGDILGIDGSNSSPSFSFSSDADTGMYREGTNEIGFATGGSRSLKLDASLNAVFSGDIYVNNSTPAINLQDSDGSNQTLEILHSGANAFFTSRNGSSNGAFFFRSYNGSTYSTALELDSSQNATFSGNLGIGASPSDTLHLSASIPIIKLTDTDTNDFHRIYGSNGGLYFDADKGNSVGSSVMGFGVDDSRVMTLLSGGNIGIGSVNPVAKLVVSDGGNAGIELQPEIATDTNRITNYDRTASAYMNFRLDALTQQFLISGSEKMRLDSSGNVGIGTTNPMGNSDGIVGLEISSGASTGLSLKSTSSSQVYSLWADASGNLKIQDNTNNLTRLTVDSSGNSTFSGIVNVSGAGLKITGQNLAHVASSMTLGHEGSSKSQIRVYGADGTTEGSLEIVTSASDGTPSTTVMLLDSNSRISLSNNDSGTSNTIFGKNTAVNIDDGSNYNVFIGENVADATTVDASLNVGVGYQALSALTTGDSNVAIGYNSMVANTSGTANVAYGRGTLATNVDGQSNTAIGHQALETFNASGSTYNTAIGMNALQAQTTATNNCFVGALSGDAITTGGYNTALGTDAMGSIVDGLRNTAIGYGAMKDTDSGTTVDGSDDNTFVGYTAGGGAWVNEDVSGIVGIGSQVMRGALETEASGTVAIGMNALYALTEGQYNIGIGFESMLETTQGDSNVAIGYRAMYRDGGLANTSNTFIGAFAGNGDWTTTASTSNTGVGNGVMQGAMNGATNNTAVGLDGLNALTTGDNNSGFGRNSLSGVQNGVQNTGVGSFAGETITTGSNNVCIGYQANVNASGATNQIAIGQGVTGQENNSVTLGNSSVTSIFAPTKTAIQSYGTVAITDGSTITLAGNNLGAGILCIYEGSAGIAGVFALAYQFSAVELAGNANTSTSDTAGKVCVINGANNHTVTIKNNTGVQRNFRIMVYSAAFN